LAAGNGAHACGTSPTISNAKGRIRNEEWEARGQSGSKTVLAVPVERSLFTESFLDLFGLSGMLSGSVY
jgi:hypothetical protein